MVRHVRRFARANTAGRALYSCTRCHFEAKVEVVGEATIDPDEEPELAENLLFADASSSPDPADRVLEKAHRDADFKLRLAACPRCGSRDRRAASIVRGQSLRRGLFAGVAVAVLAVGAAIAGGFPFWVPIVAASLFGGARFALARHQLYQRADRDVVFSRRAATQH